VKKLRKDPLKYLAKIDQSSSKQPGQGGKHKDDGHKHDGPH